MLSFANMVKSSVLASLSFPVGERINQKVNIHFCIKLDCTKVCPHPGVYCQCQSLFSLGKVTGVVKSLQCLEDYTLVELNLLLESFSHLPVVTPLICKLTQPEAMFLTTAFKTHMLDNIHPALISLWTRITGNSIHDLKSTEILQNTQFITCSQCLLFLTESKKFLPITCNHFALN